MNPFLIASQRAGEDRVTYALTSVLAQGGTRLLSSLLAALGCELPAFDGDLRTEVQLSGLDSRPDARWTVERRVTVLFENKVVERTLDRGQLERHLRVFDTSLPEERRVLLAVAPDLDAPEWWAALRKARGDIQFVYGSWSSVGRWARAEAAQRTEEDATGFLLHAFAELLATEGIQVKATTFDAALAERLIAHAHEWKSDLQRQHEAQEVFLSGVIAALKAKLSDRVPGFAPTIISRGLGRSWTPLTSSFDFYLPADLKAWSRVHVWCEVYLDQKAAQLKVRTGFLLEGKELVALWFHKAVNVATTTFGDGRAWKFSRIPGYAEVWASTPLDLEQPEKTREQVLQDLSTWTTTVLERLGAASAPTAGAVTG